MMGMWLFASATGNYAAGLIARATGGGEKTIGWWMIQKSENSEISFTTYNIIQKNGFIDVYSNVGFIACACGILLILITPLLKKLLHGSN